MPRLIDADALLEELPIHPDGGLRTVKEEGLMIRVRETVKAAPTIGGWISVKDALPRPGEDVIVLMDMQDKGKWRILAYLDDEDEPEWTSGDELWEGEDDAGEHITHWMPLPEPPKEADADDT